MRYVTATDANQQLAALLDGAQSEPVIIRRQKRDRGDSFGGGVQPPARFQRR
jgi:hypothetical protein